MVGSAASSPFAITAAVNACGSCWPDGCDNVHGFESDGARVERPRAPAAAIA